MLGGRARGVRYCASLCGAALFPEAGDLDRTCGVQRASLVSRMPRSGSGVKPSASARFYFCDGTTSSSAGDVVRRSAPDRPPAIVKSVSALASPLRALPSAFLLPFFAGVSAVDIARRSRITGLGEGWCFFDSLPQFVTIG